MLRIDYEKIIIWNCRLYHCLLSRDDIEFVTQTICKKHIASPQVDGHVQVEVELLARSQSLASKRTIFGHYILKGILSKNKDQNRHFTDK